MTDPLEEGLTKAFDAAFLDDDPQELYDAAPCAYLSMTPDGLIVKVNGTLLAWTGYDRDQLVGVTHWQQLLGAGDRIFYETQVAPMLRMQGFAREIAFDIITDAGPTLPVIANAAVKTDEMGQPLIVRVVLFDASERRAYEEELLAARHRAEASEQRAMTLARTLQASLLPPAIIEVPGADIGATYRPARDGSEVGGDFYDVIEVSATSWACVLGDVCGKGAGAAVLTALARDTIRRALMYTHSPARVLRSVRDVMIRYHPDQFCTAVMVLLTAREDGSLQIVTSVGGHPMPLHRSADGTVEELGEPGTILGLLPNGRVSEHTSVLHSGELLVLHTDGVHEARGAGGDFFGEERTIAVMDQAAAGSAQNISDTLVKAALDWQDGDASDDIAVLVIKVP